MERDLFPRSRRGRCRRAPSVHGEEVYDWVVAVVDLLLRVSVVLVALPREYVVVAADGACVILNSCLKEPHRYVTK